MWRPSVPNGLAGSRVRVDEIGARGEVSSPTVRLGIRGDRYLSEFFGGWSFSDDFIYE